MTREYGSCRDDLLGTPYLRKGVRRVESLLIFLNENRRQKYESVGWTEVDSKLSP